ncbi:hypothetical protein MHBO_003851 [Bonamia ostreae]|uniref:Peptidase M16 N-terminal domain-containing protein n=1 Tax=Bonamia ostreae TaxID=126728 RepID=A0ABV2ASG5_9EUKA
MVDQTEQTNPTKSPEDERQYRIAVLKNGIKAVLVSDPETEKGAVCMRVGIGSFSDPVDLPGTAHFLEHMLFLGTQKFPKEDFFENFLQENGGMSNAMTDNEDTKYFYDVHHTGLLPSLEKFASFFTCPLLRRESSKREINAIQSEFEMDLPHDSWRFHQLAAHISDPKTVLNRFSIGILPFLIANFGNSHN